MQKKVEYKQVTQEVVNYVAFDGTVFFDEQQCRRYEESADCAINAAFAKLKQATTYQVGVGDPWFSFSCDDTLYAVKINTVNDMEIANRWLSRNGAEKGFLLGPDAIGTIQILCAYDGGSYAVGTPEQLKQEYITAIDQIVEKLVTREGSPEEKHE